MDSAWVSIIVGAVLNIPTIYFAWRAHQRAEREQHRRTTAHPGGPVPQPPYPASGYPPQRTPGGGTPHRPALPSTGGFAIWVGWVQVIFMIMTAVYIIPDYMVHQFGSVQEYEDVYQAGVIITALTAVGLAAGAWIRGSTDLRLTGRITRRSVYLHALAALGGLIVCVAATVMNPQYVL